ncbi:MAG: polyprenyl synthetase family protein [Fidelibacterota bacterium]|nr:MAG: polyprenyl synthetase family protein [Candidatus Neomarinimicrobiota bacterium]
MTLTPSYLDALRQRINDRLNEVYPSGPRLLAEPVHYALAGKGKRLRPILTLLTYQACGGRETDALHAAVAVEILHNFTLVHDDIMDQDHTRHGQATVHTKWDDSIGILAGDALFILALSELRLSPGNLDAHTSAFVKGALAVCEGQALDKEFEAQSWVSLDECLQMIDLKTGYMMGLAAELGAICASASREQIKGVRRFGSLLGRAFQVQDDLLEIFSDAHIMGKSLGSDLLAEKKTYLMIAALERAPDQVRQAIEMARGNLEDGLAALREILLATGVMEEVETTVRQTVDGAIAEILPLGKRAEPLREFAHLVLNRKK